MRFETTGMLRRLDLARVLDLIPCFLAEWADLRFDELGAVIDPITRESRPYLALREGRHRQPGARYDVHFPTTTGERDVVSATLRHDDARQLSFTFTGARQRWAVDADLHHGRPPRLEVTAQADLGGLMRDAEIPGVANWLFGGSADGTAALVPEALMARTGQLFTAEGRSRRFRFSADVNLENTATQWNVDAVLTVRARGIVRLALLIARPVFRRKIRHAIDGFWASAPAKVAQVQKELQDLSVAVAQEGGPQPFVHRLIWDPDFPPSSDDIE